MGPWPGRASAFRLAEAGASVLIGDIDTEKAAATAAEIAEATGSRVVSTYSDAGNSASVIGLVDEAMRVFGAIDIWVNNAGLPSSVPLLDLSEEEFDKVVAITLRRSTLSQYPALVIADRGANLQSRIIPKGPLKRPL